MKLPWIRGPICPYALVGEIPALLWGFAAVILLLSLLVIWGKHKNKYSLEWFLGAVTRRSASS